MTKLRYLISVVLLGAGLQAAPVLWIHDGNGNLGTVDVATGIDVAIGNMGVVMTDIAFDPSGNLYGLSFTGFYSIDETTAAATPIGNHGVPGGNALVFGSDGTLYAAGFSGGNLYTINPGTGASTLVGNMGFASAGDLAFNGGKFYLSSSNGQLVEVNPNTGAGVAVGAFGFNNVFGLATAENGVLYGLSGSTLFSVNTATGAGTLVNTYGPGSMGDSFGSSFFLEANQPDVPEPSTLALFGIGMAGVGFARLRRRRS
jgi:outer membrane protein assembly factor BamB